MAVIRKSITFTTQQNDFVKSLIQEGRYTNDSEYIRDLIRKDEHNRRMEQKLEDALQEGLDSGVSDETVESIMAKAFERFRNKK